jgi:hypothetical protein
VHPRLHCRPTYLQGLEQLQPLYQVIGDGVKIFSSLKHILLQQFPYSPSQLVGPTAPPHLLLPLPKSSIFEDCGSGAYAYAPPAKSAGPSKPDTNTTRPPLAPLNAAAREAAVTKAVPAASGENAAPVA